MNYDLVGIGNALVDIEVQVDDAFIKEISVTKGGMTLTSAVEQEKKAPPDAWAIRATDSFAAPVDPIPGARNPDSNQNIPYPRLPRPLSKEIPICAWAGKLNQATSSENAILITPMVCECRWARFI